ncbi:phage tail assembly protein [Amycolatopsis sp. PS_44_ISF1]|uniref:phage tail assembly protein n=1 Tax=Amycolatopsis sp. PS_44_ISF1 TaxID=2974917 RepID=UPI0028DD980D|nr:phage tail assembly protein [Amycolatopsis sp. PS_44_ISF1]MDT8913132.1 phage tail assembly protein [Amycolatopsis sp. PS_44_ISF1]MDT8916324.1 phage tail assembly protein [Amycolatopsis sp. PS_44_ISF1]MDT8916330.1 phage tail assembly protein [Amycolatopsis sp. PS_44_ISF1]
MAEHPALRTEYPFALPRGYVDEQGHLHRDGLLRLATAKDELVAQAEPLVRQNPAYLSVYLITQTVTRLGTLAGVDRFVVEHLFASDLAFLQDLYRRVNQQGHTEAEVACPECEHRFLVDVAGAAPS